MNLRIKKVTALVFELEWKFTITPFIMQKNY